jgi:hypothetical protein
MSDLTSTLTCPQCGHRENEVMPENACLFFYDCKGCGVQLKPKDGDCCVFCSYGDKPCPPVSAERGEAGCCQ